MTAAVFRTTLIGDGLLWAMCARVRLYVANPVLTRPGPVTQWRTVVWC